MNVLSSNVFNTWKGNLHKSIRPRITIVIQLARLKSKQKQHSSVNYMEKASKTMQGISYRLECKYKGAGLTHYVMQSDESPF